MVRVNSHGEAVRRLSTEVSTEVYVQVRGIIVRDGITIQDWSLKLILDEIERDGIANGR